MTKEQLQKQIAMVDDKIRQACQRSGRERSEVNVIAVTKYVSLDTTRLVLDAGANHIGENRWQDAREKWKQLHDRGEWHFIGHLQTNKVKDVIGRFQYLHSLDRLSLAEAVHKKAQQEGITVKCFLQVNVSGEQSKYGLEPEQLIPFAKKVRELSTIQVIGLMTMAPYMEDKEQTRPVFQGLRKLRDDLNQQAIFKEPIQDLSMGMSNDFEVAVEEGATWVRLGSILVGKE